MEKQPGSPPPQEQELPGSEAAMQPRPLDEDPAYRPAGKLKDKVAIITGGDSGIGRAVALLFAKEGADVAIVYLNEHEDADQTAGRIEELGSRVLKMAGDIGDDAFCQKVVDETREAFGQLDIIVNNAAKQDDIEGVEALTPEQVERTFRTNLFGFFYLTRAALPYLRAGASMINTTSVQAYDPSPSLMDYAVHQGWHFELHPLAGEGIGCERHSCERGGAGTGLDAVDSRVVPRGGRGRVRTVDSHETPRSTGGDGAQLCLPRVRSRFVLYHRPGDPCQRRPQHVQLSAGIPCGESSAIFILADSLVHAQPPILEPAASADQAGLHYVTDDRPGIRRVRAGKGFRYVGPEGKSLRDVRQLQRIKSLAIPPAWTDVWICSDAQGHLQATGRDARGRKQYRYHARWRKVRDELKYDRMVDFGKALPKIRRQARQHLRQPGLTRDKVLAAIVRLLELSCIRVGNDEYARTNKSYGLTTLKDRHAKINGSRVQFHFRGKLGKEHTIDLNHPKLARVIRQCRDLPGQELFQYVDQEGVRHDVTSSEVNDYLREISGRDFTAKDFRTWTGTVLAALALAEFEQIDSQAQAKKNIVRAIEHVAERLGNTPTICKKCYVHPVIWETYLDGTLTQTLRQKAEREIRQSVGKLRPEEAAVLTLLQQQLREQRPGGLTRKLTESVRPAPNRAARTGRGFAQRPCRRSAGENHL